MVLFCESRPPASAALCIVSEMTICFRPHNSSDLVAMNGVGVLKVQTSIKLQLYLIDMPVLRISWHCAKSFAFTGTRR